MKVFPSFPDARKKQPLDPKQHTQEIRELQRAALGHRQMLLDLGHKHGIRLHYGAMMSMVEIVTFLYLYWMKLKPGQPQWPERDRFVLSKGHGAPSLYAALQMAGFIDQSSFENFRRLGSILQGHPDRKKTPGVECSTGSLGQGFPVACGIALASKLDGASYRVYVLLSDGECNEGSVWEAVQITSNLAVDTITALVDWNGKSSYGEMKGRNDIEPFAEKWKAFNWNVKECDGHDFVSLSRALHETEQKKGKPSVILCHTVKGKGIPYAETYHTRSNFFLEPEHYREAMEKLAVQEKEIADECI
jgi:transketolase